jgi:hypothetical protein
LAAETEGAVSLLEDMGSGGAAGGIGVPASAPGANTGGVSGFDPVMGKMQKRSKAPSFFDNCQIFEVPCEEFDGFKMAETWKNAPQGPTTNYLRRFKKRNPDSKIAVKNLKTGNLHWLEYE